MNRKKTRILRWRGVLADSPRMLRIMVAIVLAVAGAALTFTQLGFVAIETPSGSAGYVVVLLQVVALGALLLGTLPGTALGIVAGGVLFLHARVLPLDPYELSFITPLTSVIMFGVTGFLLGIMFAIALRNNPSRFKRVLYIVIVCVIVSVLYGVGFIVNVTISLGAEISATMGPGVSVDVVQDLAFATFHRLGDMSVQIWGTGLLMVVLCIVGDLLVRKVRVSRGTLGLRTVFGAWLGVTVALAFMVMSAVSFAVTTVDEVWDAQLNMESDASYILEQLDIAVEELFVNVCHYAYPDASPEAPGHVRIQRTYSADPARITVDIIDEGVLYNPLAKPDAVTPDDIMEVPIGGLGILMAKRCTDEMRYERVDSCNVVTIVKKW